MFFSKQNNLDRDNNTKDTNQPPLNSNFFNFDRSQYHVILLFLCFIKKWQDDNKSKPGNTTFSFFLQMKLIEMAFPAQENFIFSAKDFQNMINKDYKLLPILPQEIWREKIFRHFSKKSEKMPFNTDWKKAYLIFFDSNYWQSSYNGYKKQALLKFLIIENNTDEIKKINNGIMNEAPFTTEDFCAKDGLGHPLYHYAIKNSIITPNTETKKTLHYIYNMLNNKKIGNTKQACSRINILPINKKFVQKKHKDKDKNTIYIDLNSKTVSWCNPDTKQFEKHPIAEGNIKTLKTLKFEGVGHTLTSGKLMTSEVSDQAEFIITSEAGFDEQFISAIKLFCGYTLYYTSKLHWAAKLGLVEEAKRLASDTKKFNVNITDTDNNTPLHWACYYGHIDMIEFLISKKASVNCQNKEEFTPLDCSLQSGFDNNEVLQLLFNNKANFGSNKHTTPVLQMTRSNSISMLTYTLDQKKVNLPESYFNIYSKKLLKLMYNEGCSEEDIKSLKQDYIDQPHHKNTTRYRFNFNNQPAPNSVQKETYYVSPLTLACNNEHYDMACFLTKKSMDLTSLPKQSVVWLIETAILASDIQLIQYVFNKYVIDIDSNYHALYKIPFYAAMMGDMEMCTFLLKNASDWMTISAPKKINFDTPSQTINMLADIYETPAQIAERFNHKDIAAKLRENENSKRDEIWAPHSLPQSPPSLPYF